MTAAEATALRAGAAGLGVEVPTDALARLDCFLDLLALWNRRIRLTGARDTTTVIRKHVVDSLAALAFLPPGGPIADIGSGAGFPGIVLACVRPSLETILVEPRRRPTSFLREAIRSIPLPAARVLERRAEDAAGEAGLAGGCHAVVSRAIRVDRFLPLARPMLAPGGVVIALQTPGTASAAVSVGATLGLEVRATRDYKLPAGEMRRILVLGAVR